MLLLESSIPSEIGLPVGIGGTGLAGMIFYFYRQERDRVRELSNAAMTTLTTCLTANTSALTKLTDVVMSLETRTVCPFGGKEGVAMRELLKIKED